MTRQWNLLLMDDHRVTEQVLAAVEAGLAQSTAPPKELIAMALDYLANYVDQCHNLKEERHLFPLIEGLGVPRTGGPLAIMLGEHEESRDRLAGVKARMQAYLRDEPAVLDPLRREFSEYAALLKNHFWKENDILYPMALRVMRAEDGEQVVRGIETVEAGLGPDARERYYRLAEAIVHLGQVEDLSFGLERPILAAILNALPVEISFVDADDTLRYFSHENQDKIFPRTRGAIGTKVQDCHPQKSLDKVNQILAGFKAGRAEPADFWIDFAGKKVYIRYFPVRDRGGRYLGCLEVVQDITTIQGLSGERRLLSASG